MKYTSLDKVVKGYLLQKRLPIHFYIEFLIYAARCFQELHMDTIGNVRTVKLTINDFGEATLPADFMDWTKIGVANGQFVKPLVNRPGMNRLNNYDDATGVTIFDATFDATFESAVVQTQILYPDTDAFNNFYYGFGNTVHYNDHLEFTGRLYGAAIDRSDSFSVVPELNKIQLHQQIDATHIILEYISDGSEIDNATQITPYATATLEAFINWKLKENARSYSEYERTRAQRQFDHQHKILRARMNPLTISDIRGIIYKNSIGAPK